MLSTVLTQSSRAKKCLLIVMLGAWAFGGCDRRSPTSTPVEAGSPPTQSVASAKPPVSRGTAATPAVIQLQAARNDKRGYQVYLTIPKADFRELIAEMTDPWGCLGIPQQDGSWAVRCTPGFRTLVAEVRRHGEATRVTWVARQDKREEQKEAVIQVAVDLTKESIVTVQSAPGQSCAEGKEPKKKVLTTLSPVHNINQRNDMLYLSIGKTALLLIDHWAYKGCRPKKEGDTLAVTCPPGPKAGQGRFWLQELETGNEAIRFTWEDSAKFEGIVGLGCHDQATLTPPADFEGGITNYGVFRPGLEPAE